MAKPAAPTDPAVRVNDPSWLRDQISKLAKEAKDNADEDGQAADVEDDRAELLSARSETARYYEEQLRRILAGKTWDEAFVEMARESESKATGKRQRR
jgi:hypothetical protein